MRTWKTRLRRGTKIKFKYPTEGSVLNACRARGTGGWPEKPDDPVDMYRVTCQVPGVKGSMWILVPVDMIEVVESK